MSLLNETAIRDGVEGDHPLVYSSFLRSMRSTIPVELIDDRRFYRFYHDELERLLSRGCLLVASFRGEDEILGWLLGAGPGLVYAYVKRAFRRQGLGRELFRRWHRYSDAVDIPYHHHGPLAIEFTMGLEAATGVRFRFAHPRAV